VSNLIFYIADVFAEEKYAGNQLAVVRKAGALSAAQMQRIAKEMNYSETTFIVSEEPRNGGYDVRIFTPAEEVPFAGHPTLGTAHIIRREITREAVGTVVLNLQVGQIPVTFGASGEDPDLYWMRQMEVHEGQSFDPAIIAPVLSLDRSDIDERFPVQEISTGLPHFIVPVKTLAALKHARVVKEKYLDFIKQTWAKSILVFCPETYSKNPGVSVRVFADYYGVPEDPATGSGNGCLAGYLAKRRYWGTDKIDVRSEQGYEIGRPSLLFLRAEDRAGKVDVVVGGKVITVARGELI
jgi:trans-2,3-dihydro-3-hydroxyanthranilate isomerase